MSQSDITRQKLIEPDYEPVSSSRKLNLLRQRSARYSYRQRCCKCCPAILCELLFPITIILLLTLTRYGLNRLAEKQNNHENLPGAFSKSLCSQEINTPPTSSNDIFSNCFKFPPSYKGGRWSSHTLDDVSNKTNIVFEPNRTDVNELVQRATIRLAAMKCNNTNIWSHDSDDKMDMHLLQNKTINTVIVDFSATSDLRKEHNLV
ncbi:unnamed protein product, partial [Rotaria sp. Silwood2]